MSGMEIFERVRTQLERKKIYDSLAQAEGVLTCKEGDESLFLLQIKVHLESMGLLGVMKILTSQPRFNQPVITNFKIKQNRYFVQGKLVAENNERVLFVPEDNLFLLQRRAHVRIGLPEQLERDVNIIGHNKKMIFIPAKVIDVSLGGSRVEFQAGKLDLKFGDIVRIVFHIRNKWLVETLAEVRHVKRESMVTSTGLKFVDMDVPTTHKLTMMVLELQKLFLVGDKNQ